MIGTNKNCFGAWAAMALAVVLAVALMVVVLGTPREADAASRYKTVTKTFSEPNTIVINSVEGAYTTNYASATPYPSTIDVSGFRKGRVKDVNLELNGYSHPLPDEVAVLLVGPRGQNLVAMSDVGGEFGLGGGCDEFGCNDPIWLVLDDEAASHLPDNARIAAGAYKPTQGTAEDVEGSSPRPTNFPSPAPVGPYGEWLSALDGTNPNGTWRLYVIDDFFYGGGGQFAGGWSLQIRARVLR